MLVAGYQHGRLEPATLIDPARRCPERAGGESRAELSSVRRVFGAANTNALHAELQKHIESITVDIKGLITIKGSLSGALKSVLKLVAGVGLEPTTLRL